MVRYPVVAHETVTNPKLLAEARAIRHSDPDAEFVLLIPATPVRHLLRRGNEHNAEVVEAKYGLPVHHVMADREWMVGDLP